MSVAAANHTTIGINRYSLIVIASFFVGMAGLSRTVLAQDVSEAVLDHLKSSSLVCRWVLWATGWVLRGTSARMFVHGLSMCLGLPHGMVAEFSG